MTKFCATLVFPALSCNNAIGKKVIPNPTTILGIAPSTQSVASPKSPHATPQLARKASWPASSALTATQELRRYRAGPRTQPTSNIQHPPFGRLDRSILTATQGTPPLPSGLRTQPTSNIQHPLDIGRRSLI